MLNVGDERLLSEGSSSWVSLYSFYFITDEQKNIAGGLQVVNLTDNCYLQDWDWAK
jgi:hypothetical protein